MTNIRIAAAVAALFIPAGALFAAGPDWTKVPSKTITLVYPGVSPIEWIRKGIDHSGARGMKHGETCVDCHEKESVDLGKRIATGEKLEPKPIKGKVGSIPVAVQAANDGANLYMRFTWKQPAPPSGDKMDAENAVKLAFMLEDNKVELAHLGGCWSTCHSDLRTMPEAKDDKKTKYVKDGNVGSGIYYDLIQWRSGSGKGVDGHVADKRVMEGGKALVSAEGKEANGTWTVTFVRKLEGGEGDIALKSGKTYNFGFAIHDANAAGRYHHVSFGYTLGIDAKAQINAAKQ